MAGLPGEERLLLQSYNILAVNVVSGYTCHSHGAACRCDCPALAPSALPTSPRTQPSHNSKEGCGATPAEGVPVGGHVQGKPRADGSLGERELV